MSTEETVPSCCFGDNVQKYAAFGAFLIFAVSIRIGLS